MFAAGKSSILHTFHKYQHSLTEAPLVVEDLARSLNWLPEPLGLKLHCTNDLKRLWQHSLPINIRMRLQPRLETATMENPAQQFIVAPLNIGINRVGISHGKRISVTNFQRPQLASKNRDMITPPITPQQIKDDKEELEGTPTTEQRPFIDYLRACYPYYPPYDATSETVTLPLNAGDIILIHSVDANGWADGTLLNSGLRGWLPTNFCEAYDIEPMQNLLTALTNLFDLVRSGTDEYLVKFYNQDYTRAMVAGVRYLLVSCRGRCRGRCISARGSFMSTFELTKFRNVLDV